MFPKNHRRKSRRKCVIRTWQFVRNSWGGTILFPARAFGIVIVAASVPFFRISMFPVYNRSTVIGVPGGHSCDYPREIRRDTAARRRRSFRACRRDPSFRFRASSASAVASRRRDEQHDENRDKRKRRWGSYFAFETGADRTTLWTTRVVMKRVTVTLHVSHVAVGAVGMLPHVGSTATRMMRSRGR